MLVDTSGLACMHNKSEPFHHEAVAASDAAPVRLTHSYVLAEYVPLATTRRLSRAAAVNYLADLPGNPDIEVIWVDEDLHDAGVDLLLARPD